MMPGSIVPRHQARVIPKPSVAVSDEVMPPLARTKDGLIWASRSRDRADQRSTDRTSDHQAAHRIVARHQRSAGSDHDVAIGVVVLQHFAACAATSLT